MFLGYGWTLDGDGLLTIYSDTAWEHKCWHAGDPRALILAEGVTYVPANFFWCANLQSVVFPETLTCLGNGAFDCCQYVKEITLPPRLTEIPDFAFSDCYSLVRVTVPPSVKKIGIFAFSCCHALQSITLPKDCDTNADAFYDCPAKITYC